MSELEEKPDLNEEQDLKEKQTIDYAELINSIKEILKEVNFNEIVNSFNNVKIEKIKSDELKNSENLKAQQTLNDGNRKFWKMKFLKECFFLVSIIICVTTLAYYNKIDNCSLGTLLGSIIGYSIGNFNSYNNNS